MVSENNLHNVTSKQLILSKITTLFLLLFLGSCSLMLKDDTELYGPASPQNRYLTPQESKSNTYISYTKKVQPILNTRCAVCHSCNDAPCQINFTSIEGIDRGASTAPVYNGLRFLSQEPTRLGIDASTTAQWRDKSFTPILNERRQSTQINLDNSLLYKVLTTKRAHNFSTQGRLSEEYGIGVDLIKEESFIHSQTCPNTTSYSDFAKSNPQWGMPFVFPALSPAEFDTIETWLKQGARVEPRKELPNKLKNEVKKWEVFLNGTTNKQKLMSRYLYEHLFVGHIYFEDSSKKDFFTLVRSKTAPGQDIEIINTVRPYNSPKVEQFYYRLKLYTRTIVSKTHMPYALSDKRMKRYTQLFIEPEYTVSTLPSYDIKSSANPFKTFVAIPSKNRYEFLLDDAQYFVSGFIKGPVCRGSIALSVIDDHFWVAFKDPDKSYVSQDSKFLAEMSDKLKLPSEQENDAWMLSVWNTYNETANKFFLEKLSYLTQKFPNKKGYALEQIWDGEHQNPNAALTIYRHHDTATVLTGFVGEIPKTAWVLDYPLFERIHYLLVAGFDVYGTVGHQLSSRLYMEILRTEAELEFLAFLPLKKRVELHRYWYRETKITDNLIKQLNEVNFSFETKIKYQTDDVKKEFFVKVAKLLKGAHPVRADFNINLCVEFPEQCEKNKITDIQKSLIKLNSLKGTHTNVFPNVTFLRINIDGSLKNDLVYTIIRNKAYINITSLGTSEDLREPSEDTIDIVSGFVGSYPNFFLQVNYDELDNFVKQYEDIDNKEKYNLLVDNYGIRRNNPNFWEVSDWFYKKYQYDDPLFAGLFDLNRYKNR